MSGVELILVAGAVAIAGVLGLVLSASRAAKGEADQEGIDPSKLARPGQGLAWSPGPGSRRVDPAPRTGPGAPPFASDAEHDTWPGAAPLPVDPEPPLLPETPPRPHTPGPATPARTAPPPQDAEPGLARLPQLRRAPEAAHRRGTSPDPDPEPREVRHLDGPPAETHSWADNPDDGAQPQAGVQAPLPPSSAGGGAGHPADPGHGPAAQAGLWGPGSAALVLTSRVLLGATLGGAAHLLLSPLLPLGPLTLLPSLAAAVVGAALPGTVLVQLREIRRGRLRRQLPDALDLVATCLDGGLAVERSLVLTAAGLEEAAPELAQELEELLAEWRVGRPRHGAIERVDRRCEVRALRGFLETVEEASRHGSPVGASLEQQAEALRRAEAARIEDWSKRLPTRISITVLIFIVPPLFVLLLGSSVVQAIRALEGG